MDARMRVLLLALLVTLLLSGCASPTPVVNPTEPQSRITPRGLVVNTSVSDVAATITATPETTGTATATPTETTMPTATPTIDVSGNTAPFQENEHFLVVAVISGGESARREIELHMKRFRKKVGKRIKGEIKAFSAAPEQRKRLLGESESEHESDAKSR